MSAQPISAQHLEYAVDGKRVGLGMMSSHRWHMDPKVLLFSMARYKFAAKMLSGAGNVLEIGCGDGWGTHLVAREVQALHAIDVDPLMIQECLATCIDARITFAVHDLLAEPLPTRYDAAYLLDVLEHIAPEDEPRLLAHLAGSLKPEGVCIVGIPSLESQAYASKPSRATHVNCKSGAAFRRLMQTCFRHVFLFSMNDEVVHTGFAPMAHYLLCLCAGIREEVRDV